MNDSDVGYCEESFGYFVLEIGNKKPANKQKIFAEGLLSQEEAYSAAMKLNAVKKQKLDLHEKDSGKMLTDDGRELLNED